MSEQDSFQCHANGPDYGTLAFAHRDSVNKKVEEGSSPYSGYVNLINSVIGSGILGLPIAFASTGWILGYILITLAAAASSFSLHLLVCCAKKVPRPASFDRITEAAFPGYGFIVDLVVSCLCFGNATSYLIVISKLMPEALHYFGAGLFWENRQVWVTLAMLVVGPLSFKKSLDALEFTNSMSLVSVLFIAAILVAYSLHFPSLDPCADDLEQCENSSTALLSLSKSTVSYLGVFVFSYTCQMNLFPLVNEMASPTIGRCNKVIGSALFTAMILYSIVAGAGYVTYGDMVQSDVLVNYPFTPLTSFARVAVSALVACSYPLQCGPSRNCALSLWRTISGDIYVTEDKEKMRFNTFTVFFLLLGYSIAMTVDDLGVVLALIGATGSTIINYILPGAVFYRLYSNNSDSSGHWKRMAAFGLCCLGCIIMPVCVAFIFI